MTRQIEIIGVHPAGKHKTVQDLDEKSAHRGLCRCLPHTRFRLGLDWVSEAKRGVCPISYMDLGQIAQREFIWNSTQLNVLDIVRPLILLWNRLGPNSDKGAILESAIHLWVKAQF